MLTALAFVALGVALGDAPSLQVVVFGASAGLMVARIMLVVMEHGGAPVSDIHRRRIDAAWAVLGATLGAIAYILLG